MYNVHRIQIMHALARSIFFFFSFVLFPIVGAQRIGDHYRARAHGVRDLCAGDAHAANAFCFGFSMRIIGK